MIKRIAVVTLLLCTATLVTAQNGNDLFQQALIRQTASGDVQGAIQIYERILRDFSSNRALAARALVQLGKCHELLGQAKSREYYEQVLSKYSDQTSAVAEVRARLSLDSPIEIATAATDDPLGFAISPDGRSVAFAVTVAGRGQLWLHDLVNGKAAPIAGANLVSLSSSLSTSAAPFWSPDSKFIGYFSDQKLKRIDATGGTAQTLADAPAPAGGTWNSDGIILFVPSSFGLYRVPADGSGPAVAFGTGRNSYPQFLPDGQRFLYYSQNVAAVYGLVSQVLRIGSLDDSATTALPVQALSGVFGAPDHLLYATDKGLMTQQFDPQTFELSGNSTRLSDRIAVLPTTGALGASVSASGRLAYRPTVSIRERQLVWLDRQGRPVDPAFAPDPAGLCCVRISPDGQTISFGRKAWSGILSARQIWTIENTVGGEAEHRNPGAEAVWGPGDSSISAGQEHRDQAVWTLLFRGGRRVHESDEHEKPDDWSKDGRFLLYEKIVGGDLMVLPLSTDVQPQAGEPIPVAATPAEERNGRFSPDAKWIAYQSNEIDQRTEIFVQPFPGSIADRHRLSLNGGTSPAWSNDGSELYFLSPDFHLMTVSVHRLQNGNVDFSSPEPLLSEPLPAGSEYDAWNGQRFLINRPTRTTATPIIVLSNWSQQAR